MPGPGYRPVMQEAPPDEVIEQLEDLRRAVSALRWPVLIMGVVGTLAMLLYGVALVFVAVAMVGQLGRPWGPGPVQVLAQLALLVFLYGAVAWPMTLLLRAGIAGLRSRTDPQQLLQLARYHERYWVWTLGLTVSVGAVVLLLLVCTGM